MFRSDGTRPRDGAGLGSPILVEPGHLLWSDPLVALRRTLLSSVDSSELETLFSHLAVLSDWKVALEDGVDVSQLNLDFSLVGLAWDSSFTVVRKALLAVQTSLQQETDRLISENILAWQQSLQHEGFVFDLSIDKGQPFRLNLLAELTSLPDPNWWESPATAAPLDLDWKFVRECQAGLSLGVSPPLSESPHFPRKSDLTLSECDFVAWARNYRSAEELEHRVRECLREDLELGVVEGGYSWRALCARLRIPAHTPEPDKSLRCSQLIPGIAVSRLGCIDESVFSPGGECLEEKFRLVFDGTVSGVNDNVFLPVLAETPTFLDGEALFSVSHSEALIGCKIDVKSAFKRLLLRHDQYRYTLFPLGDEWFFSKSCPMGMKSSPYHWVRFNSLIHRLLKRLGQNTYHASLMYIDDSLYVAPGSKAYRLFSLFLVMLRLLGVPISWKKLEAGSQLNWVGFRLDFTWKRAYLSESRLQKLEVQMADLASQGRVSLKSFRQLTFRMVWVSQSFPMSKAFLHEFFRRLHAPKVKAEGFVYDVSNLNPIFDLWTTMIKAARSWVSAAIPRPPRSLALTRTDAAAEPAGVFLGGWHSASPAAFARGEISWFAFKVSKTFFPLEKEANNHVISAAEALAVAIAVAFWGSALLESDSMVTVLGSKKWYSRSPNLSKAFQLLVRASYLRKVRPKISWTSGESNQLADSLSRKSIDAKAARHLAWLPAGRRISSQVLWDYLPELQEFLLEI